MKLFLASNNAHKAAEFAALAAMCRGPVRPEIQSARAAGGMPAVEEDADTFAGNALKKARALRAVLPPDGWALADDSGLCVDALGGAPGVRSARYAGSGASDADNLAKLVDALRNVPATERGAEFGCALALVGPDGAEQVFEGVCRGRLRAEPSGTGGFGYDPLFLPEGETRTFAEMGAPEKNSCSHRARAWAALAAWLETM